MRVAYLLRRCLQSFQAFFSCPPVLYLFIFLCGGAGPPLTGGQALTASGLCVQILVWLSRKCVNILLILEVRKYKSLVKRWLLCPFCGELDSFMVWIILIASRVHPGIVNLVYGVGFVVGKIVSNGVTVTRPVWSHLYVVTHPCWSLCGVCFQVHIHTTSIQHLSTPAQPELGYLLYYLY